MRSRAALSTWLGGPPARAKRHAIHVQCPCASRTKVVGANPPRRCRSSSFAVLPYELGLPLKAMSAPGAWAECRGRARSSSPSRRRSWCARWRRSSSRCPCLGGTADDRVPAGQAGGERPACASLCKNKRCSAIRNLGAPVLHIETMSNNTVAPPSFVGDSPRAWPARGATAKWPASLRRRSGR